MRFSQTVSFCILLVFATSCQKLDIEMPIQVVNLDGSPEANYFEERLEQKLEKRNFIIVGHETPLKMYIENFVIRVYQSTETVYDDCGGGHNTYTLEEEILEGDVFLMEGGYVVDQWNIEASNREVLKENDPILLQIIFPEEEDDEYCSDYWVKQRDRMQANLRACARRIAAQATKKVNRLQ